jgi:hypothetical protein
MTATAKVIQRLEPSGATCSRPIPDFATLMLITGFAPYRPELHYMRGPGPGWHAKHDPRCIVRRCSRPFEDVSGRRCASNH